MTRPARTRADAAAAQSGAASRKKANARPVESGDISPSLKPEALAAYVASEATAAARGAQVEAALRLTQDDTAGTTEERARGLLALLEGAAPDDRKALRKALRSARPAAEEVDPDEALAPDWRDGGYPYKNLLRRATYEKEKFKLQVELLKLQNWVKETGARVVIIF